MVDLHITCGIGDGFMLPQALLQYFPALLPPTRGAPSRTENTCRYMYSIMSLVCLVTVLQLQVDPPADPQESEHDTHQVGNDQVEHKDDDSDGYITGEEGTHGGDTEPVLGDIPAPDKEHHDGDQGKSFRVEERCEDSDHHDHDGDNGTYLQELELFCITTSKNTFEHSNYLFSFDFVICLIG